MDHLLRVRQRVSRGARGNDSGAQRSAHTQDALLQLARKSNVRRTEHNTAQHTTRDAIRDRRTERHMSNILIIVLCGGAERRD